MTARYISFDEVRGYRSYKLAHKRGLEVAAARPNLSYRWVVIALPSGRFAPMVIINNELPGGPGQFLGELNLCMAN